MIALTQTHRTAVAPTATEPALALFGFDTQAATHGPAGLPGSRNEAISLPDMVHAVCTELRPLLAHHRITLLFNGDARALPLVFGQRAPLRTALWECLEAAVVHARLGVEPQRSLALEMGFSTDANQVHLTLRSLGAIEEVTLTDSGHALPLAQPPAGVAPAPEPRQHVVFPFARLLLHSLGGQVVVHHSDGGDLACTLSLPCADERATAEAHQAHHAQIYAGLLTRLTHNGWPTGPQMAQ
jgi:hypothetical protein